jgi:hypothetical protein
MGFTLAYVVPQNIRIHTATAYQAQSAGITNGRSQFPAAAPYHPTLNDGKFYAQKPGNTVFHINASVW